MPRFHYQALNAQQQPQSRVIEADSLAAAVVELEAAGLTIQSIAQAAEPSLDEPPLNDPAIVAAVERVFAAKEQLVEPLHAYGQEMPSGKRRRELLEIVQVLTAGSLDDAINAVLQKPLVWGPLLGAAARDDGEASVFARFVERDQPVAVLRRRRSFALVYPLLVLGLTVLVAWPIARFLLPTFREIYDSFGLQLPGITRAVFAVGDFFDQGGGYLLLSLGAALLLAWITLSWWAPRWLIGLANYVTTRGEGEALASARLARVAADFVEAGLTVPAAQASATQAINSLAGSSKTGRRSSPPTLPEGRSLAFAFTQEMSKASRAKLLRQLSLCHGEHATQRDIWIDGLAGPLAIVAIGFVVGTVVLALFGPLVGLVQGLT